jgi:hypothetical protein
MGELKQERPSISLDKQQINYENAVHPSRSARHQAQPLLDPAKAAALLEKGSQFAQKTMQRPISFVGKIFQGLGDSSGNNSRAESPTDDESRYLQGQYYQQAMWNEQQEQQEHAPMLPPRPHPQQELLEQQQQQQQQQYQIQFDQSLQTLNNMFTNVDSSVCYLVLHANHGDLVKSVEK